MESNNSFLSKIEGLIKEIIAQSGIPYYRIDSMMETQVNAALNSTVMVPVIRIISYFEDSVNRVGNVLANEFDVTIVNSVDKNNSTTESFSSQQVHFSAGLKENRLALTEYKRWGTTRFEVQVFSVLQDAWSHMEREITSGGATLVPDEVKRDFYRVGALLESADIEFAKIKNQITKRKGGTAAPGFQQAANDWRSAPAATPVYSHNAAMPQPAAVAQPAPISLETMDMNVDSFDSLAFNVNNVENKNGEASDHFIDLLSGGSSKTATNGVHIPSKATEEVIIPQPAYAPVAEPVREEAPVAAAPAPPAEGVALNIDNIETFNMNVNGIIERNTEIIREGSSADVTGFASSANHEEHHEPVVMDENAPMTDASLREYVLSSKLLKEIDQMIADRAGAKVNDDIDIEGDVERLKFLKVFTLKQLHEKLTDNKIDIVAFAEKWIGKDNGGSFDSGISLFYLEYLLVGKKNDPAFAVEYVLKFISDNDYSARYIIPTYNSVKQTEQPATFAHLTLK